MAVQYRMFIGGAWVGSGSRAGFGAPSPGPGEGVGTVPGGPRADAQRAIAAAGEAWQGWGALSAFDRAAKLRRMAEIAAGRRGDPAHTLALGPGRPPRGG